MGVVARLGCERLVGGDDLQVVQPSVAEADIVKLGLKPTHLVVDVLPFVVMRAPHSSDRTKPVHARRDVEHLNGQGLSQIIRERIDGGEVLL